MGAVGLREVLGAGRAEDSACLGSQVLQRRHSSVAQGVCWCSPVHLNRFILLCFRTYSWSMVMVLSVATSWVEISE